jgi:hypothetical protein
MNSKDPVTVRPDGVEVVGVAEGDNGGLAARRRAVILARGRGSVASWSKAGNVLHRFFNGR